MRQYVSYSQTSRKPMIQLGGEVLYNIPIEFGVPMKLVGLINMCLNETHSKDRIGNIILIIFLSRMV
jgi:hypothetical protein